MYNIKLKFSKVFQLKHSLAYVIHFYDKVIATKSHKLAINGVFTVDKIFLDRFPLKFLRKFELGCCWFYHQSELLTKKMTNQE